MTELYIIRHGQTAANVAGLKQGTIDDERTYLSETGIAQAKELAGDRKSTRLNSSHRL